MSYINKKYVMDTKMYDRYDILARIFWYEKQAYAEIYCIGDTEVNELMKQICKHISEAGENFTYFRIESEYIGRITRTKYNYRVKIDFTYSSTVLTPLEELKHRFKVGIKEYE